MKNTVIFILTLASLTLLPNDSRAAKESVSSFGNQVSAADLDYYGLSPAEEAGKRKLSATLFIDTYYDSNIFIANANESGDFVTLIKPYITYETNPDKLAGQKHEFGIYYAPEFLIFADNDSENAINHSAQAAYRYNGKNSFLRATHRFRQASGANLDIGSRSNLLQQVTNINGGVDFLEDYTLLYGGRQNLRYFDFQNDRHDWNLNSFLLRNMTKQLKLGIGGKGGWVDVANSPNQTYEQILGRLIYNIRKDLTFDLQAGAEFRQFEGPFSIGDESEFVYNARLNWEIFEGTGLSVSSYRSINASSGLNAANYLVSGFRGQIAHSISDDWGVRLGGGYENAEYYSTVTTAATTLRFDYFYLRPSVNWSPTDYLLFELYYKYAENDASVVPRDFERHQVGLQTTIEF